MYSPQDYTHDVESNEAYSEKKEEPDNESLHAILSTIDEGEDSE